MSDTFDVYETVRPGVRDLPAGASFELQFSPQVGRVTISVGTLRPVDPPEQDPETGELLTVVARLRVQLFRPGLVAAVRSHVVSGSVANTFAPLVYDVPADQTGGTWRCRYTNSGVAVRFRPSVEFVSRMLPLKRTAIPLRVLNHGLAQLIRAVDLRIHLDGNRSYVDFSDEAKQLTGATIQRQSLNVPELEHIEDVNLSAIEVMVISPLHTRQGQATWGPPAINIRLQFETRGEEVDTGFVDVDLQHAILLVSLGMTGDFDERGRPTETVRITPTVRAGLSGRLYDDVFNHALSILVPGLRLGPDSLADVRVGIEEGVRRLLDGALPAVGDYLARGLAQLCNYRAHFVDIASDATSLIVTHYAPDAGAAPTLPLLNAPFTPSDLRAATQMDPDELANLDKIENIVVLVQENRSFDHMLGYLRKDSGRIDVDGLIGTETNVVPGKRAVVQPLSNTVFLFDPPHDHPEVLRQINEGAMTGFLATFIDRHLHVDYRLSMGHYTKRQVPTYDFLASQFLICDRWFCSHPGPTQPNRMSLVLGGRIPELGQFMADSPALGFLALPTFFDLLTERGVGWVYYEQDVAFLRFFDAFRLDNEHLVPFDDPREGFAARAAAGTLPNVTFIEPSFLNIPSVKPANDDHPPTDIRHGQDMIACIYNALVSSPQWEKTMFVITYDEHGGFYDHVPPPGTRRSTSQVTVPQMHPDGPSFYGPRVPAFVVSPWVTQGGVDHTVFDHTSIAKTIVLKFLRRTPSRPGELVSYPTMSSRRLVHAAHFGRLLTRKQPRLDPPKLQVTCPPQATGVRRTTARPAPDDFHEGMRRLGRPKFRRP